MFEENIKTWTGKEADIQNFYEKVEYYENQIRPAFKNLQQQLIENAQNGDFESFENVVENCRQSDLISFEFKQHDNLLTVTAITIRFEHEHVFFRIHNSYTENEISIS